MKRSTFLSLLAALPLALLVAACDSTPTAIEQTDNSSTTIKAKPGSGSTTPNPAIAFTDRYFTNKSQSTSKTGISVMDANGGNVTSIYSVDGNNWVTNPAWSPDGSKIAFVQSWPGVTNSWTEIMVIDVSLATDSRGNTVVKGTNPRRLTFAGQLGRNYDRPTWGENSAVIYFTSNYFTGSGANEQRTAEILAVPVTGGAVTTIYSNTSSRSDALYFADLGYNLSTSEFAVNKRRHIGTYSNGQWSETVSQNTMDVMVYNSSTAVWQFDANRSWANGGDLDWSHSGASLLFKAATSIGVTANSAGSTPTYLNTTLVRPAASPSEVKFAALDWGGRKIYAVDFSGGTPQQTLLHTLPAGDSESTYLSWKRGQ